jgi:hypothetical protein
MTDTARINLPLLSPSQAQKHVTVNEALAKIDAVLQLSVLSRTLGTPPVTVAEGDAYLAPLGATDAWEGWDDHIVFYVNGGWDAVAVQAGWQLWVHDEAVRTSFDGVDWKDDASAVSTSGAATRAEVVEFDFDLSAGASLETGFVIPAQTSVWGVTGLVLDPITGSLSDWSLGAETSDTRYGSGLGLGAGSWLKGLTGQPVTYYAATKLRLTANGGDFAGGKVRLAVHLMQFDLPRA